MKIVRRIRSLVRRRSDVVRRNSQQHSILPESLKVVGVTQNIVSGGPFDGMRLPDIDTWGQDRGSKLLSFYEQELHPTIREIIDWGPDKIINVGCAEGYYAVGLARLNPNALVVAFDTDEKAQYACTIAGRLNGVSNLQIRGLCTISELIENTRNASRPFILLDCEGGERELLLSDSYKFPQARILVECHDFLDREITSDLVNKYSGSHTIRRITQGARNPFEHPLTAGWPEHELWQLTSEHRPEQMHWLYMIPAIARNR